MQVENHCDARRILIVALPILVLVGCGDGRPTRVPVSGQVLIDGQPLKYGFVRFMPANARASGARLDENGRFSLTCFEPNDGAVIGTHQVTINAGQMIARDKLKWHAPKKYVAPETAGIQQEIKEPVDNLTINLTWDGGGPFVEQVDEAEEGDLPRATQK